MPSNKQPNFLLMVLTGALCVIILISFSRLAFGLVLPDMRDGLGLNNSDMANLGTATGLGYLCLVMAAGLFAARWGGRRSVLLGLVLVITGFIGLSQASDYRWLLGLMVLLGCGTAFGYTPLISLLSNSFPNRRGKVLGFVNSGVGLGMLLSGYLVPLISGGELGTDWRDVWVVFAMAASFVWLLAFAVLQEPDIGHMQAVEYLNTALPSERIYRNRQVIRVGITYGMVGLTYIVQAIFMYSYALDTGLTPATAGGLVSMTGLLSIIAGPFWGSISDRIGHSRCQLICMSLVLVGMALPVIWPVFWVFAIHYFLLGLFTVGMFTSTQAMSTDHVPAAQAAMAISFITVFFAAGQLFGPFIAGAFLEWSESFRLTFTGVCLTLGVGLIFSWQLYREDRRH